MAVPPLGTYEEDMAQPVKFTKSMFTDDIYVDKILITNVILYGNSSITYNGIELVGDVNQVVPFDDIDNLLGIFNYRDDLLYGQTPFYGSSSYRCASLDKGYLIYFKLSYVGSDIFENCVDCLECPEDCGNTYGYYGDNNSFDSGNCVSFNRLYSNQVCPIICPCCNGSNLIKPIINSGIESSFNQFSFIESVNYDILGRVVNIDKVMITDYTLSGEDQGNYIQYNGQDLRPQLPLAIMLSDIDDLKVLINDSNDYSYTISYIPSMYNQRVYNSVDSTTLTNSECQIFGGTIQCTDITGRAYIFGGTSSPSCESGLEELPTEWRTTGYTFEKSNFTNDDNIDKMLITNVEVVGGDGSYLRLELFGDEPNIEDGFQSIEISFDYNNYIFWYIDQLKTLVIPEYNHDYPNVSQYAELEIKYRLAYKGSTRWGEECILQKTYIRS